MSSPSPPPLPVSRSSRKPRSSSPHPNSAPNVSSKTTRSQSRAPPPSPAPPNILRQTSNASSNASSATYVEPLPEVSWRQRSREARHPEQSPVVPSQQVYPSEQGAYMTRGPSDSSKILPTSAWARKSTIDDRTDRIYAQSRDPPRFIVQSPSNSSMDRGRDSGETAWSQPSVHELRTNPGRLPDMPHRDEHAHIRALSAAGGLRSPADLARPKSTSRSSNKGKDRSLSPQVTPTMPPASPTFEYNSPSTNFSPNVQTASAADSMSPHMFAYDKYSRYPSMTGTSPGDKDNYGGRTRNQSSRTAVANEEDNSPNVTRQHLRSRSRGATDSHSDRGYQRSVGSNLPSNEGEREVPHTSATGAEKVYSRSPVSHGTPVISPSPVVPPIPPRHPWSVSPNFQQAPTPPALPPRRTLPVSDATPIPCETVNPPLRRRDRQKSGLVYETAGQNEPEQRERSVPPRDVKPLKAVTADELTIALAAPPHEAIQAVERVKRERTTTWTAGQVHDPVLNSSSRAFEEACPPASEARKRERTRSVGTEKESVRHGRERTRSAATTLQRKQTDTFEQDDDAGKRSRTKSGGTLLQDSSRRDTVSDDMHAILMGKMPELAEAGAVTRASRQTPRRKSSRGSMAADNPPNDPEEIARNRAEALAALSAPNTPKEKRQSGRKSRPVTPSEDSRKNEPVKLKGLGMDIPLLQEKERIHQNPPFQSFNGRVPARMDNMETPSPNPDYSHLFAALADPYTPPVIEPQQPEHEELETVILAPSDNETDGPQPEEYDDNGDEVVWDGRGQEDHEPQEPQYERSPQVPDLQRKSSTLRPPTSKRVLTSSTSVSSLAWSGDEEVEKGMNFAASRLLAGLNDVPEELEEDIPHQYHAHDLKPHHAETSVLNEPQEDIRTSGVQQKTWRSTLSSTATYQSLLERYGSLEVQRQELIFELTTSESAFVHDMRLVIRLFIQPLRDRSHPPTWIPGVPADVGRLFDWLDDIVQVHADIVRVLHSARQSQYPVVLSFARLLLPVIPKLEIHQPYLVRLEEVSRTIDNMMKQPESDFGEFLRMQSVSDEWDGLSLGSWLLKPVQRLTKYASFFKQILQSTPRNHQDHISSMSLYYSTDTVIRIMQEVKAREEEYDMVRMLASRMTGLPKHFRLAERGRRLLAQGPLLRLEVSQRTSGEYTDVKPTRISSRDRNRTGTYNPRMSMQSINHSDGSSYDWPTTPSLGLNGSPYASTDGMSATKTPSPRHGGQGDYFGRTTLSRQGSTRSSSSDERISGTSIYAFLFTDVIVLGTPLSERNPLLQNTRRSKRAPQWQLLGDVGLARVMAYTECPHKFGYEFVLRVDLCPELPGDVVFSHASPPTTIYLSLPESFSSQVDSLEAMKKTWLNAFESSVLHTLRSLSFPSIAPLRMPLEFCFTSPTSPPLSDEHLPRSPSSFAQDNAGPVETERGEREWWSHRFKQVVNEFLRDRGYRPDIVEIQAGPTGTLAQRKEKPDRRKKMSTVHQGVPAPLTLVTASAVNTKHSEKGRVAVPENQGGIMRLLGRRGA